MDSPTLIFGPVVLQRAFIVLNRRAGQREQRMAGLAIFLALGLGLTGLLFALLLVLHLIQ